MSEACPTISRSYRFGPFRLDVNERRLWRGDLSVPLRSRVFDTLLVLVENSGRLVKKTDLLRLVWPDSTVEESNLTHNLSVLRKALRTEAADTSYIVTIPGKGYRFTAPVDVPIERSIAVLPFTNMSSDPEQSFFCDGMSEELINALTQVEGLRVVARTSSFEFRGTNVDVRQVGERLGVSLLLEGSVRKFGNRVRVTAQLIRASDGSHLWSERYDRELSDMFAIQDDIANAIVAHVSAAVLGTLPSPRIKRPTQNQAVYHLYLEARHHRARENAEGTARAIELLRRALALEPTFAAGYALLARCYTTLCIYGLAPGDDVAAQAERAAARALELDDTLADAHRALGSIRSGCFWDWTAAQHAFERSLRLDPRAPGPHRAYAANFLAPLGRMAEAEREIRIAVDLDPLSPLESRLLAQILFWSRQYDAAVQQLRHTLELDASFPMTRTLLAAVYTSMGRPDQALEERVAELQSMGRPAAAEELHRAYDAGGEEAVLRSQVESGLLRVKTGRAHPFSLALLYSQLNDRESAFDWLETAAGQRGGLTLYTKVHPWLDNLRADARFDRYLDRMGVNDPKLLSPPAG
jgi:serine/threonine-protein kinase